MAEMRVNLLAAPVYLSRSPQGTGNITGVYSALKHNIQPAGLCGPCTPACPTPCKWGLLFPSVAADVRERDTTPCLSSHPLKSSGLSSSLQAHVRLQHLRWEPHCPPFLLANPPLVCPIAKHPCFLLRPPFSDLASQGKGQHSEVMFLPGPADGGLLREIADCLGFGVGKRDDIIVLAPVLVHGCVEDAAGGGAGGEPGVVQPGDCGSCADNSRVVTPHELFIHLVVPLLSQGRLPKNREGLVSGENALVLYLLSLSARLFLGGLASSSWLQLS